VVETTEIYFLKIPEGRISRTGCQNGWAQVRAVFLPCGKWANFPGSTRGREGEKERERERERAFWCLFL
jgi:hypothetical protein